MLQFVVDSHLLPLGAHSFCVFAFLCAYEKYLLYYIRFRHFYLVQYTCETQNASFEQVFLDSRVTYINGMRRSLKQNVFWF